MCFQYDMVYGDLRSKRTASNKITRNKLFNIAKNIAYDGYQRAITSTVYYFFDNKTSGDAVKNEVL